MQVNQFIDEIQGHSKQEKKKTMSHLLIFSAKWLYFTDVMTLRVGIEVLIMCYHKQSVSLFSLIWTLKIFSSLSLIIVIMKVNHESMSPMFFVFLSQDICHIKIESEVSIWFVNLYWIEKKNMVIIEFIFILQSTVFIHLVFGSDFFMNLIKYEINILMDE